MAKSPAKKARLKKEREHLRNPELNRKTNKDYADIHLFVRVSKNEKKYNRNKVKKNHLQSLKGDRDGFYYVTIFRTIAVGLS